MDIQKKINAGLVFFDGGTGTMLQEWGLKPGELPELWNLTHPEKIIAPLHKAYLDAGCDVIKTNTFGANRLKFHGRGRRARRWRRSSPPPSAVQNGTARRYGNRQGDVRSRSDMRPTGKLLQTAGAIWRFEDAVALFAEVVSCARRSDAARIAFSSKPWDDSYETKAAVSRRRKETVGPCPSLQPTRTIVKRKADDRR